MNRRMLLASLLLPLLAGAASAATRTVEAPAAASPIEERLALRTLFERAPGVVLSEVDGITIGPGAPQVLVARIGPDGKLIKACVDSEAAARRFFDAPVETLATKKARQ